MKKIRSANLFPVVGIGASAGGLDAFKKLVKAIPEDSGMAYILVQHLDPAHESILSDLLQKVTKIPVQQITDNIEVEPDHIYIIPSNKLLTATDGVLQLSARLGRDQQNLPINLFFTSLAEVHQNHAIGVVLSGTASDGTLGLKAIKDHGGITFAQEQGSAAYASMPQSAIDAGVVDFILPPEEIPAKLLLLGDSSGLVTENGAPDSGTTPKEDNDEKAFKRILLTLRKSRGVDFTYYKQTTIRRRIRRRIAMSMKENIDDYLSFLEGDKEEQTILYQDLLIPVTNFFRDPKMYEQMVKTVFPVILKDGMDNEPIRVWIAGCSTGEEAYSLSISMFEYMESRALNLKLQIFATDISETAIAKARGGIYTANDVTGLSTDRLAKFFTKSDGKFRLNKIIRENCIFAEHNYLTDPPFAKIDLICCRNSLIYLQPFLQKKALATFHYALKQRGFLILGKSETIAQAAELYNDFDKTNRFYTRKNVPGNFLHVIGDRKDTKIKNNREPETENGKDDFQKSADGMLLLKYSPPGVIVNEMLDIVQFRGATGMWLEPPGGKPSTNLLKMAREGLSFELRSALHKVKKTKQPFIKENIPIRFAGMVHSVAIEVTQLADTIELYFLILFRDTTLVTGSITNGPEDGKSSDGIPVPKSRREMVRTKQLEKELAAAREDMRSVTEDQEAANEELQSANEELLSGSEELQSLNEELETSKEEVQTSNEELIIVNQELFDRNEQLNLSRIYAESIVTTIREPLIILNAQLKVRSANRAFYDKFQVLEEQILGRSFFELGKEEWNTPELRRMLERVISHEDSIVEFEVSADFPKLGNRTMLLNAVRFNTENNGEQSILIAFEDVTEKRQLDKKARELSAELERKVMERTLSLHGANIDLQLSNENLAQFAYIASHDLQEPLRKIQVFSSILRDKYYDDMTADVKKFVSKISASSERMSSLIRELLNFSSLLHSNEAFIQTDLDGILNSVIIDFDMLIGEKDVIINREPLPVIDAIPFQMNQLFYNLISNSIKYSKKDTTPVITITSKILTLEEMAEHTHINLKYSYCEISIQDNGIGFRQEQSDKIFLVFQRLHGLEKYSGTGIGLALCRKIVANHHGEISAESKEGEGALFRILLPIKLIDPGVHGSVSIDQPLPQPFAGSL